MTMRGPASTLSACAHVHTHYKKAQWCMFGGSTPRGGGRGWDVLPSSTEGVGHNGDVNRLEATALGHVQRCYRCVTDNVTHLAVTDQVSHRLQ